MRIIEALSRFFPPLTRAIKFLLIANFGLFALMVLLQAMFSSAFIGQLFHAFGLVPRAVMHGKIWQLATYAFLHGSLSHVFGNMLGLWLFGSMLEQDWGYRKFMEFYFFTAVGAAVVTTLISFTGVFGLSPDIPTIGASGGVFGILMGAALVHGKQIFYIYFLFPIQVRFLVLIYGIMQIMGLVSGGQGVAYAAHLSGMLFGYLYIRYISDKRKLTRLLSARGLTFCQKYQRWKLQRRRKKFGEYMRKHDPDYRFPED